MFARRLATQSSSSPPALPHQLSNEIIDRARRPSTIEDTEGENSPSTQTSSSKFQLTPAEPRSSPASSRGTKPTRGARRSAANKRRSRLQEEARPPAGRRGSKTSTTDDHDDAVENGEDGEGEAAEEDAASSLASPAPKSDRPGTKSARGKMKRGRGGARRGGRRR